MFRVIYHSMNEKLAPSGTLEQATLDKMAARPHRRPARRVLTTVVALALVLCISVTAVAAAVNESFRQLLFGEGAPTAEALTPQTVVTEQDGLRLEVLGSMAGEDSMTVYYTLQDVAGLGRVQERMNIEPMIQLKESPDVCVSVSHRVLDFDAERKTVFCRADVTANYDKTGFREKTVELSLRNIYTLKDGCAYAPVDMAGIQTEGESMPVYGIYHYNVPGYSTNEEHLESMEDLYERQRQHRVEMKKAEAEGRSYDYSITVLDEFEDESGKPVVLTPEDGLEGMDLGVARITAMGFVNDMLHVQVYCPDWEQWVYSPNHFNLVCAKKGEGEKVAEKLDEIAGMYNQVNGVMHYFALVHRYLAGNMVFGFDQEDRANFRYPEGKYNEYVFRVSPDHIEDYELFAAWGQFQEEPADLTVEFPAGAGFENATVEYKGVEVGGVKFTSIQISPMSVTVIGPWFKEEKGLEDLKEVEIICGGQTTLFKLLEHGVPYVSFSGTLNLETGERIDSGSGNTSQTELNLITETAPIDPKTVTAIRVNGQEIPLTPME